VGPGGREEDLDPVDGGDVVQPGPGEREPPQPDDGARREAPDGAVEADVQEEDARGGEHRVRGVGQHHEGEGDRRGHHPLRGVGAERPHPGVDRDEGEQERQRPDDAAGREVPLEHRRGRGEEHRRERRLPCGPRKLRREAVVDEHVRDDQ